MIVVITADFVSHLLSTQVDVYTAAVRMAIAGI